MKSKSFLTLHRQQQNPHKIVHVTSVVQPQFYTEENTLLKSLFGFSLSTESFLVASKKLRFNHWCHMDYLNNFLTTVLGLERFSSIAVYPGSESSRISSQICSFVFRRWTKVLQVWNNMRVSNSWQNRMIFFNRSDLCTTWLHLFG